VFLLPLVIIGLAVFGAIVMWLWNWLMPALFDGARAIGYWQALGLLLLSRILFGGFGRGGHGRHCHHDHRWRERWHARWHAREDADRYPREDGDKRPRDDDGPAR
jgi:hypothetical protein